MDRKYCARYGLQRTPQLHSFTIFVDDLDRCVPRKIAEVVDAINLFLCGDYPTLTSSQNLIPLVGVYAKPIIQQVLAYTETDGRLQL
jgi:hypothetical protein